jgi:large subunit ribosomal protein L10
LEFIPGGINMPREEKVTQVNELADIIAQSSIGVVIDYRGITAVKATEMRRQMREHQVSVRIVKNTLARLAAKQAGREDVAELFNGPTALISSSTDEVEPARTLDAYLRSSGIDMEIMGGFFPSRMLSASDINTLAKLPSREVLIAQILGGMQAPISGLVNCLVSPIRGIMGVLEARKQQLEAE